MHCKLLTLAGTMILMSQFALGADTTITVNTDKPGARISPTLYGIFYEEINRAGDGGLYAEMLQNRSFEDAKDKADAWNYSGEISLDRTSPLNSKNPTSLKVSTGGGTEWMLMNRGFGFRRADARQNRGDIASNGLSIQAGQSYKLVAFLRSDTPSNLSVKLIRSNGTALGTGTIKAVGSKWKQYSVEVKADATDPAATLLITGTGTVWLDQVSMMPSKNWKGLPLRNDIGVMLDDLKPAFVRFPGGCFVEGYNFTSSERWKDTLGSVEERPGHPAFWGYQSTGGLGIFEYFLWCEKLNSEPLYVINCGMSHAGSIPMAEMGEWVQDALDLIEYARGPVTSKWGALRAKAGHPAPFKLNYLEIGNENGGPDYFERYALFYDAIKAKYPDIKLVANHWLGTYPKNRPVDLVDEHAYSNPNYFLANAERYDSYDRKGYKVYMGEYAVTEGSGQGNLIAGVAEAAFMLGMERNSDIVLMSSYAPLLCNVVQKAWNPNAINFDQSRIYGTPSYHIQSMFAKNVGHQVMNTKVDRTQNQEPVTGKVGLGTWKTQAEYKDIVVEQNGKVLYSSETNKGLDKWKSIQGQWRANGNVLTQSSLDQDCRAVFGDANWSNYTYSLKARKVSGDEGFLVMFGIGDDQERIWWNLGGWNNTNHALEFGGGRVAPVNGRIEADRWYDIKIKVDGNRVQCFLDGKLIHDVVRPTPKTVHALGTLDEKTGELIVKIVNASKNAEKMTVNIAGSKKFSFPTQGWVIQGNPSDENTLDQPKKVVPKEVKLNKVNGNTFLVPATSVTVMRLKPTR